MIMENHYNCIYMYVNKVNNKKYIGQAKNFNKRHKGHLESSNNEKNKSYNHQFHKAIRKYGISNFEIKILEENIESKKELNEKEIFYIKMYDTFKRGYNATFGGDGGNTFVDKTIDEVREIRENIAKQNSIKVVAVDINDINKVYVFNGMNDAERQLGILFNEKYLACNISRVCQYNHDQEIYKKTHKTFRTKIKNLTFFYKTDYDNMTSNDIIKILNDVVVNQLERLNSSDAKFKAKKSQESRRIPIAQYDENMNLIKIWDSGTTIRKELGIDNSSILRVCKGKQQTAGGFKWRYINES